MRLIPAFATVVGLMMVSGCQQPAGNPVPEPADAPVTGPPAGAIPVMPFDAPPQEEVDPALVPSGAIPVSGSCRSQIGPAAAARLVERCMQVSPATRPPCNVDNACALIRQEIDRSCAMYGPEDTRPPACEA